MKLRHVLKACSAGLVSVVLVGFSPAWAAGKLALIIGNGAYQNATALPNPPNDAAKVQEILSGIGFDVISLVDGTKQQMDGKVREFIERADNYDVAMFFYAGHGMQVDGVNYLIPIDAKLETKTALEYETVNTDKLLQFISSDTRIGLVYLDACRNNPLSRSFARKSRAAGVGEGLAAPKGSLPNLLIAFATAPGEVALDGDGANSPFVTAISKHLHAPKRELRAVMTDVKLEVKNLTKGAQLPWTNDNLVTNVYLNGAPDDEGTKTVKKDDTGKTAGGDPQPQTDPAREAWEAVKDQKNPAIFDELSRSFPGTYYANAAVLRAQELRDAELKEREAEERQLALLLAEEKRQADEKRRAEAARKAEEKRKAEEAKRKAVQVDPAPAPVPKPAKLRWGVLIGTHTSLSAAKARQREARGNGLNAIFVKTDDYPGLSPGYWAVLVPAISREDAKAKAIRIRAFYGDANARPLQ